MLDEEKMLTAPPENVAAMFHALIRAAPLYCSASIRYFHSSVFLLQCFGYKVIYLPPLFAPVLLLHHLELVAHFSHSCVLHAVLIC